VSGNSVSPTADINFAQYATGPTTPLTHWAVGTSQNGRGKVLYKGLLNNPIVPTPGSIPQITTQASITED
jgi:hypothetical protein